jgi:regulator of sigma E protease
MLIGWNIFWFIIGVSLLVTVHEFGHFWVARKLGFKVLRFSVGFGKPLYKWVGSAPDHTEYVIAALPLGGYVRMLDERDGEVSREDLPRAFASKPPWQRILVMLAGPAANILFAIVVLWFVFANSGQDLRKPIVGDVRLNSPAAIAGLRSGDEFLSIGADPTPDHSDVLFGLLDMVSGEGSAAVDVRGRDGQIRHLTLSVPGAEQRRELTEPHWASISGDRHHRHALARSPRVDPRSLPASSGAISSSRRTGRGSRTTGSSPNTSMPGRAKRCSSTCGVRSRPSRFA